MLYLKKIPFKGLPIEAAVHPRTGAVAVVVQQGTERMPMQFPPSTDLQALEALCQLCFEMGKGAKDAATLQSIEATLKLCSASFNLPTELAKK